LRFSLRFFSYFSALLFPFSPPFLGH
jgi:hypothetical protein